MIANRKMMLPVARTSLLLSVAVLAFGCHSKERPVLSTSPLSTEQLDVYRGLLNSLPSNQAKNLANQTSLFSPSRVPEGSVCLQGVELESGSQSSQTVHSFGAEIDEGRSLRLVDPTEQAKILQQKDSPSQKRGEDSAKESSESGFLVVSEIVFDKKHHFAVLNYVFFCGPKCKYAVTLVLEKLGEQWTAKTRRTCAVSVN